MNFTKVGEDKLAKNTPNAPKYICPNCLSKLQILGFPWKKALLGVRSAWFGNITCTHYSLSDNLSSCVGRTNTGFSRTPPFSTIPYKGAFLNYVDKILPIFDHLPSSYPCWHLWQNLFTVIMESLSFKSTPTYFKHEGDNGDTQYRKEFLEFINKDEYGKCPFQFSDILCVIFTLSV